MKKERLPFNNWSKERISQGRKKCTSRTRVYNDDRVICVVPLPLGIIKKYLWKEEGADSPEELQKVINQIFRRSVPEDRVLYVHFGDYSDEVQ